MIVLPPATTSECTTSTVEGYEFSIIREKPVAQSPTDSVVACTLLTVAVTLSHAVPVSPTVTTEVVPSSPKRTVCPEETSSRKIAVVLDHRFDASLRPPTSYILNPSVALFCTVRVNLMNVATSLADTGNSTLTTPVAAPIPLYEAPKGSDIRTTPSSRIAKLDPLILISMVRLPYRLKSTLTFLRFLRFLRCLYPLRRYSQNLND